MNAWLFVLLLVTSNAPDVSNTALRSAKPGEAAAAAYELFNGDDRDIRRCSSGDWVACQRMFAACAAFLDQVRSGSEDPWSFRGAALCAAKVPTTRETVQSVLNDFPEESPLALFVLGYLHFLDEDLVEAERRLRRAVDQAPDFALAWNALGAVVRASGDATSALPYIERALELSPSLGVAQRNLEQAQLYTQVFDRMLTLLKELPGRWATLPEPRVPMSGRRPKEVFSASSEQEVRIALSFISALAHSPLRERDGLIERWLEEKEPTEVDLWWPLKLTENEMKNSIDEAALTAEAWLQWATATGRRDVVFFAGAMGFNVAQMRLSSENLISILRLWMELPVAEGTDNGVAQITLQYGRTLQLLGKNRAALDAYRKARKLFQAGGDRLGEGNTFYGEAEAHSSLGDYKQALAAHKKARTLSENPVIGSERETASRVRPQPSST